MIKLKKVFIFSLIVLLIISPISSAYVQNNSKFRNNKELLNPFIIQLTEENVIMIHNFILNNYTSIEKIRMENLLNNLINEKNQLDMESFYYLIEEKGYQNIFYPSETTGIEDDLLNFLMEMIEDRLGWVYDFYQKSSYLLYTSQELLNDRALPKEIIDELFILIDNLNDIQILLSALINKEYITFLKDWSPGLIIQEITEIIDSIEIIAEDIGILFGDIQQFIYSVSDFINWFVSEPWKQPIHIYGQVIKGLEGIANINVSCQNAISITNESGFFDFYIDVTPSNTSIPPNTYYGIHNCIIYVNNNEELSSSMLLSYVFSDGGIYWLFILSNDSANKSNKFNQPYNFFNGFNEIEGKITSYEALRSVNTNIWKVLFNSFKNNHIIAFNWQLILEKIQQ